MLANDVREALIDGGGGVQLKVSGHVVTWKQEDVDAVLNQPAAFRAGAIGPDNMVFPGMTDPSHAIGVRPYEQCQLLYDAALIPEERAYAMGCFLHGATDAVAHHYVNYMSGETFTLTPITSARQQSFTNVVRHILAEEMIQASAYAARPTDFASGQLLHAIPKGFVLRTYMDETSPLWAMMAHHSKQKFDAAAAGNPGASFVTVLQKSGLAAADHLALAPYYVSRVEAQREALRGQLQGAVKAMQSPSTPEGAQLQVKAGPDGKLGTKDDTTACSASCASLYAKYFVYAGLLAPRFDAQSQMLPPVFDKVSDKLGADLRGLLPAELSTIEQLSNKLNTPLTPQSQGLGVTKADIDQAFLPMTSWASQITTIDYESVVQAVAPDWLISTQNTLNSLGLNIKVSDIVKAAFAPVVDPIKEGIKQYVVDEAKSFLLTLVDAYDQQKGPIEAEYATRLKKAAGAGLSGTPIDHFYTSGLYLHSFNVAAAALTEHKLVLPVGDDPVGVGPASFDASHTPRWMQAGLCDYLRAAVFPLGVDVKGSLTVVEGGKTFTAQVTDDSPAECHDGSLSKFAAAPTTSTCALVELDALLADPAHDGSVSRAYPPALGAKAPPCLDLAVPGLPDPPLPGAGGAAGAAGAGGASVAGAGGASQSSGAGGAAGGAGRGSAGTTSSAGASGASGAAPGNAATPDAADDGGGCACAVPGDGASGSAPRGWAWLLLAGALWSRWRRRAAASACAAATLSLGCGGGDASEDPAPPGGAAGAGPGGAAGSAAGGVAGAAGSPAGAGGSGTAGASGLGGAAGGAGASGASSGGGGGAGGASGASGASGGGAGGAGGGGASGAGGKAGQGGSTGSKAAQLLKDLGQSTWHGAAPRQKGAGTVTRAFQLEFDADSLQWAEIMNPWGPSRARELRVFSVASDGETLTTTVMSPAGWPVSPNNGKKQEFTVKILPGAPRTLELQAAGGQKETYTEGALAAPTDGLTATVNVFSSGEVSDAFCTSGVGGFDYPLLFDFARGKTSKDKLGTDTVAGAKLRTWKEPQGSNSFSVTNVDGFQLNGGTDLSDQFNFFVWYQGTIKHPGGPLKIREADDSVEDGVWAFVGDKVGSANTNDLFLEVHGFPWADKTSDEPSRAISAGDVPIEVFVVRCAKPIEPVDVQVDLGGGWKLLGDAQTKPKLGPTLFPPALF